MVISSLFTALLLSDNLSEKEKTQTKKSGSEYSFILFDCSCILKHKHKSNLQGKIKHQ